MIGGAVCEDSTWFMSIFRLPKNIWVRAFLVSLLPPLIIFFPILVSKIGWIIKLTSQFNYGFNDFDCGYDYPEQCNMFQYIYGGWDGGFGMLFAGAAFLVSMVIANYIAFIVFLRRRKSTYTRLVLYGGIGALVVGGIAILLLGVYS